MQLKTIELTNWCQHRKFSASFGPGLNGVLGPNGKGKSNVLDAIRFAVTGESVNSGNKKDNLTYGETAGKVVLTFEVNGVEHEITRAIETDRVRLKYGKETLAKAGEVKEFLQHLWSTGMKTLLDNVFVPQKRLDAILYAKPSDRLKEFQATFGLDRAADAHRWLGVEIGSYEVTPNLAEQVQQAVQLVLDAKRTLANTEIECATAHHEIEKRLPAESIILRALEAQRTQAALVNADKQVEDAQKRLQDNEVTLQTADQTSNQFKAALSGVGPQIELIVSQIRSLEIGVSQWAQAEQIRKDLAVLEQQLSALGTPPTDDTIKVLYDAATQSAATATQLKTLAQNPKQRPRLPEEEQAIGDLAAATLNYAFAERQPDSSKELQDLWAQLTALRKEIGAFDTGICPTCGQPAHGGPEEAAKRKAAEKALVEKGTVLAAAEQAKWQADLAVAKRRVTELRTLVDQYDQAGRQALQVQLAGAQSAAQSDAAALLNANNALQAHNDLRQRVAIAKASLGNAPSEKPDEAKLAQLRMFHGEHQRMELAARDAETAVKMAQRAVDDCKQALERAKAFRASIGAAVAMPSVAEIDAAKVACDELSTWRAKERELQSTLGATRGLLEQRESEARRLVEKSAKESDDAAWVAHISKVREVLHVGNLPALMMREYARILNVRIEYYLEVWEAPFRMWLDDDLAFQVEFTAGEKKGFKHTAERLSGGESIVASASFRLAMSDTFARQVGLLVLDEPSNHLDDENIQHLANLLLKLKELSLHTGRQILIVTHAQKLMGFLDNVITV